MSQNQWSFAFHLLTTATMSTALWNGNLQLHVDSDFPVIDSLNDVIYICGKTSTCIDSIFQTSLHFPKIRSQADPRYALFVDMLRKEKIFYFWLGTVTPL